MATVSVAAAVGVRVCVAVGVGEGGTGVELGEPVVGEAGTEVSVGEDGVEVAPPPPLWVTRTETQSRKKSREVELETLITRTRKLVLEKSAGPHGRPHVSVVLPRMDVAILVPRVPVTFVAVQVVPPSQDSCTHILGELEVLSARASRRTSMPLMAAPLGIEKP
jgi:hypothetical protein